MNQMNIKIVQQKMLDGDPNVVLKELNDLYRRTEILHTPQLGRILDALFPVWKGLLSTKFPPQEKSNEIHRCRKTLLQLLARLPSNDALRPYVTELLHMLLDVLNRDNEENALIALKTLFDLHRNYRPGLSGEVDPFLKLVDRMYKSFAQTINKQFTVVAGNQQIPSVLTPTRVMQTSNSVSTDEESKEDKLESSSAPAARESNEDSEKINSDETKTSISIETTRAINTQTESNNNAEVSAASMNEESKLDTLQSQSASENKQGNAKESTSNTPISDKNNASTTADRKQLIHEYMIASSMESFKAISELPLIIMLLFQGYPNFIEKYIPTLVPQMLKALALRAPDNAMHTHLPKYMDLMDCQVKTLSFVTYLLRGCAVLMRPYQDSICENTAKLLVACPKDAYALRKEIFFAARGIISMDFRRSFYPYLELLMDDSVLVGRGRCSFYQIRPLAYSTLADMIHHVRDMLTLSQISKIVEFYSMRIHDPTLPIPIQTTSIRLLLNLVDISAKNDDADGWKGRNILARILLTISGKFGTTLAKLPYALASNMKHINMKAHDVPSSTKFPLKGNHSNDKSITSSDFLDGGAMDKIRQSPLLPKEQLTKSPYELKLESLLKDHIVSKSHIQAQSYCDDNLSDDEPSVRDIKSLLRTMILGIRAVIWCTTNYRNPNARDLTTEANFSDSNNGSLASQRQSGGSNAGTGIMGSEGFTTGVSALGNAGISSSTSTAGYVDSIARSYPLTDDERMLIRKVFQNGLRCFMLYTLSENTLAEEKQMLDHFAGAFTVLEAADFRDLFLSNIDLLYKCILQDHAILTIPQHFLANSNVSCWFAEILLKFLIAQMSDLSVPTDTSSGDFTDTTREEKVLRIGSIEKFENMFSVSAAERSSIVMRLFKIVFGSVTLFKSNESALFPHLRTIIEACLKEATYTKHPDNYLLLLRALFRSISGGKYENFYKEVLPLLPDMLSALTRLQKHVAKPCMQEVLLELCLTIPARLSSLLQYLPSLMKSVLHAILSRGELAYLGLRTLEFWVDNLNPDFLYPMIMTSQDRLLTEIIEALNSHLKPPPYPYGELAMRILGKIGGRNRQFAMDPLNLEFQKLEVKGLSIVFKTAAPLSLNNEEGVCTIPIEMDLILEKASQFLLRSIRKRPNSLQRWTRANSKLDNRTGDVSEELIEGESDESLHNASTSHGTITQNGSHQTIGMVNGFTLANSSGANNPSLLFEKDSQTLEIEAQTIENIRLTMIRQKRNAFRIISQAAIISMNVHDIRKSFGNGSPRRDSASFNQATDVSDDKEHTPVEDDEGIEDGVDEEDNDEETDGYGSGFHIARSISEDGCRKVRKELLMCLVETTVDSDLGNEAMQLLDGICVHLTIDMLNYVDRSKTNFSALSSLRPSTLLPSARGQSPGGHLATPKRIETLREATYGVPHIINPSSFAVQDLFCFNQVILTALSSPDTLIVTTGKNLLSVIIQTAIGVFGSATAAIETGGALFNSLCEVFAQACHDKQNWRMKIGGTLGLKFLIKSLEPKWTHENELTIIKSLFFVLTDHPAEVSAIISAEAGETLLTAVEKAWKVHQKVDKSPNESSQQSQNELHTTATSPQTSEVPSEEENRKNKEEMECFLSCVSFQDTEIFQIFVVEVLSSKAPVRKYAKSCISLYADLAQQTISNLLLPYHNLLFKQIIGTNLRSLNVCTRIGYIDAMAYVLSLKPPIFTLNDELMSFLHDVWRLVAEDAPPTQSINGRSPNQSGGVYTPIDVNITGTGSNSGSNVQIVSAQGYPFSLSQGCELRIVAVKLLRAVFVAVPDELNQYQEARNRFVGTFFKYLTNHPLELVTCAQQALSDVIQLNHQNQSKDVLVPKELLQECLRPILLNLADYRKLNLPLLDGLSRLLSLLSNCFNVTLGEKLLEHLKQWCDPDRIIKAGIWKRGEEPAVAAAIIDLFHLLPPNNSFVDSLISIVVELEAVLGNYGSYGKMSSPYRQPLLRFINRYPSQTVTYFLNRERLTDSRHTFLFHQLLQKPEAQPLRSVLIGEGGAEAIVTATFVAAAKLPVSGYGLDFASTSPHKPQLESRVSGSEDAKIHSQISGNTLGVYTKSNTSANSVTDSRNVSSRPFVAKHQNQLPSQQSIKSNAHIQIQMHAQKLHSQTLAQAQAQGMSLVQAQAKAQQASKEYIAKTHGLPLGNSTFTNSGVAVLPTASHQQQQIHAQQLHTQIQLNAQKVHAQALAAAQAQGLKPMQAQEKAKQAQITYIQRAKAQAQAKLARAHTQQSQMVPATNNVSATANVGPTASGSLPVSGKPAGGSSNGTVLSKLQIEALELHYQGLRIVRTLSKLHPEWLAKESIIIECLRKIWRSSSRIQRLVSYDTLPIKYHLESKILIKCFITYCHVKPQDVQMLLDMLQVFLHRSTFDFTFLRHFYIKVALTYTPENKKAIIPIFLRMLRDPNVSEKLKVYSLQLLVIPLLTIAFEDPNINNVQVMDSDTVMWALREILASKENPDTSGNQTNDREAIQSLRIELLKLGTLLIQHMSKYINEHRIEVIKFAWNHLKAQDLTAKMWAYVNVCRFISVYETPPKIVLQVYVALLRNYEIDAMFLVRKAFDILLPALPSRLPSNEFIKAIKWTKKIAWEEGHILGQLVHIWSLIVRHPALFYPFRGQFVPLMVNSLNRLAIPPSATPDNRRLAVNIVDLVISWEQTRQERIKFKKEESHGNFSRDQQSDPPLASTQSVLSNASGAGVVPESESTTGLSRSLGVKRTSPSSHSGTEETKVGDETIATKKQKIASVVAGSDHSIDNSRHEEESVPAGYGAKVTASVSTAKTDIANNIETSVPEGRLSSVTYETGTVSNNASTVANENMNKSREKSAGETSNVIPLLLSGGSTEDEYELSQPTIDLVVNFAFRFALASADKHETLRLSKPCGDLFDKALRLWPSASIRLSYFDKLIAVTADAIIRHQQQAKISQLGLSHTSSSTLDHINTSAGIINVTIGGASVPSTPKSSDADIPQSGNANTPSHTASPIPRFFVVPRGAPLASLTILDAVLGILNSLISQEVVENVAKFRPAVPYVVQFAPRIMKLLEPCFDRQNSEIQMQLNSFLKRMAELFPPSHPPTQLVECKFYPWLQEIINERLINVIKLYDQSHTTTINIGNLTMNSNSAANGSSGGSTKVKNRHIGSPLKSKAESKVKLSGSPGKHSSSAESNHGSTKRQKTKVSNSISSNTEAMVGSTIGDQSNLRTPGLTQLQFRSSQGLATAASNSAATSSNLLSNSNFSWTTAKCMLTLLETISSVAPEYVTNFLPILLKLTQKLSNEHLHNCNIMKKLDKVGGFGLVPTPTSLAITADLATKSTTSTSDVSSSPNVRATGMKTVSSVKSSTNRHRVMATPSLAIVEEWNKIVNGRSTLSINSFLRYQQVPGLVGNVGLNGKEITTGMTMTIGNLATTTNGKKKNSDNVGSGQTKVSKKRQLQQQGIPANHTTSNPTSVPTLFSSSDASSTVHNSLRPHLPVRILVQCFTLLSKCSFVLKDHRRLYVGLLVNILEGSLNVPLLLCITKIASSLILAHPHDIEDALPANTFALSANEKVALLSKMSTFDRLTEVNAIPLNGEYLKVVLELCRREIVASPASTIHQSLLPHFISGLLTPDVQVRSQFLKLFCAQAATIDLTSSTGNLSKKIEEECKSMPSILTRLDYVLRQDWHSCATRFWPVIAIETLLSAIAPNSRPAIFEGTANVIVTQPDKETNNNQPLIVEAFVGEQNKTDEKEIASALDAKRMADISTAEGDGLPLNYVAIHSRFLEVCSNVCANELIISMGEFAHIDLDFAKELWINLFRGAWNLLDDTKVNHVYTLSDVDNTDMNHGIALDEPDPKLRLSQNIRKLLSSRFHKRDLKLPLSSTSQRINVVQLLLEGIVSLSGQSIPIVPPELINHLASLYDVWGPCLRICEFQVNNFSLSVDTRLRWVEVLSSIYKMLSEGDLRVGLCMENIKLPETRAALTLEALGCVHEAQEKYFTAISTTQTNKFSAQTASGSLGDLTLFELRLWEERWVECAKQLCQWQLMNDFAKSAQSPALLLDCAWKRGDWHTAKQLLISPSLQAAVEFGLPETRLQRLYIAILDGENRNSIDQFASQTAELALYEWEGLPKILSKSHIPLLHLFHKFVEVKESIQIMADIKAAAATVVSNPSAAQLLNLKPSINTWRERLPNKYEPILLWDDILTWRSHMFQVIKTTFSYSDPQVLACMHDAPWSIIQLAHTARKQHLPDVCLGALTKLNTTLTMDVHDAFAKETEQAAICYESSTEYANGLSKLNSTNLSFYSSRQKAELIRLKALFLDAMGNKEDANRTFSQCLQLCDSYGKGWLSWGHYCYNLYIERKEVSFASETIACYLQAIHHRCNSARLMIARVLWLLSTEDPHGVLIQAFESHGKQLPIWIWIIWIPQLLVALGRREAPQIRGLLRGLSAKFPQSLYYTMRSFFLENRGNVGPISSTTGMPPSTRDRKSVASTTTNGLNQNDQQTRPTVFARTNTGHVVALPATLSESQLLQIPGLNPPFRSSPVPFGVALEEVLPYDVWKKRHSRSLTDSSIGSGQPQSSHSIEPSQFHSLSNLEAVGTVQYTKDLINFLRRTHDTLAFEMECIVEQLYTRFRPEPEEELLTTVHSLLVKCYRLPPLPASAPVPKVLQIALNKMCRKLFMLPDQCSQKHLRFVHEFKEKFQQDFAPDIESNTSNENEGSNSQAVKSKHEKETEGEANTDTPVPLLLDIMNRLKFWKDKLERRVRKENSSCNGRLCVPLEHCSRHLVELSNSNVEVPGQYLSDAEPIKDLHARILHFEANVEILLRNGYTQRRVGIGGSDGKRFSFLVQFIMTHVTRTDERITQMYLLLNRLLVRHKETQKRNATFNIPKVIPLAPRARLLEDHRDLITLGEIYDRYSSRLGRDPDLPIQIYRSYISNAIAQINTSTSEEETNPKLEQESIQEAKVKAFDVICSEYVPETLLSHYVAGISTHWDAYFQFRNEVTKHLALASFFTHIMFIGDRVPHRLLISKKTGQVVTSEVFPGYAANGTLEPLSNAIPFRLTRNLHSFITRPGVQGPFSIIVTAVAESLIAEEGILSNQLSLFFRDDLASWQASKARIPQHFAAPTTIQSGSTVESGSSSKTLSENSSIPDQDLRQLNSQIQQKVEKNVSLVLDRIRGLSLKKDSENQQGKSIRELLDIATSPEHQREMHPTWAPWL